VCEDEVLPDKSLTRRVFDNNQPRILDDVGLEPLNYECGAGMKSEILVPLKHGDRCLGVLN
jgi:putative methionine-R-sulfoxide reductase with GAF domain